MPSDPTLSPIVTCGVCGRSFPDIYPSARCPFEYEHALTDEQSAQEEIARLHDAAPRLLRALKAVVEADSRIMYDRTHTGYTELTAAFAEASAAIREATGEGAE